MATSDTIQLQVIDSAVAKRVLQRRTVRSYAVEAGNTSSSHIMYVDTPQRDLLHAGHALALVMPNKGSQQLNWYAVKDDAVPQCIESYEIHDRQWPAAVLQWLRNRQIPVHHLIPTAHYITKSTQRRIKDAQHNELVIATLTQGIISIHGTHEAWDTLTLHSVAPARSHEIDSILEYLYQQIPHRLDQRTPWQRIHALSRNSRYAPSIDDAIVQQAIMLMGFQHTADEALFVPLIMHDSDSNRQQVATLIRMHHQKDLALEPFWLATPPDTHARLEQLFPRTASPSYTALVPPVDVRHLSFSEVLRLRLRSRLRSLLEREADVVNGYSAYDVHRIRVVLRKMRALIECSEGIYDAEVLAQFRRGFRRMARFLGEMRDCDAFGDHVLRILEVHQLPAPFARGVSHIRDKALTQFQALLMDDKHQHFLQQFAEFVTTPNSGSLLTVQPVPKVLAQRIHQSVKKLTHPHPKSLIKMNDDALHELRITAKHLRYLLEGFGDLLLPAGDTALQRLIIIQDQLGAIQDAVVAHQLLTRMHLLNTAEGKRIIQTLRQEAHQQRLALPDIWATCQDDTFRDSIDASLTQLPT